MDGLSEKAPLLKTSPPSCGEYLTCPLGRRHEVSAYRSTAVHRHHEYTPGQHRHHEYTPDQHRHLEYTPDQRQHHEYTPDQQRHHEYTPDQQRHHEYIPDQQRHHGHAPDQRHHPEYCLDHHDHHHEHSPGPQPQHRPHRRQAFLSSGSARAAETAPPTDSDQVSDTLSQNSSSEEHPGHRVARTPRRVGTGSLGDGDGIVREDSEKASVDVTRGQKRRMTLVTLVTIFWACAGKFHSPLVTQYTYQVYTESVYGNASAGIHISKHPCVNDTGGASRVDARDDEVQDQSADLLMRLEMVTSGISTLVNVFLGSYSDVLGRRFVLFLSLFGHFLRNATAPVIIYWDLGLPALYTGYVVDGLCGGSSGIYLGLYLYAADITRADHQRTLGMSVIETAVGLTSAATNLCAGWVIQQTGFLYASLVASLLLLFSLMLVACLPETVKSERKRYLSPAEAVKRVFDIYRARGHSHDRALLLLSLFLFYLLSSDSKVTNLYLMNEPLCWSSIQIGTFLSAKDGISRIASVSLIALLQRCLPTPYLAIIGAVSGSGSNVLMGLARSDLMLYMVTVVSMALSVLSPSIRAMMSRTVPPDKQGAMFASLAVVESASLCLSPFAFLTIYKSTMHTMRGFTFFVSGGIFLFIVFIYLIYLCLVRRVVPEQMEPISVQANNESESQ